MKKDKGSKLAIARAYVHQFAPYFGPTLYGLVPQAVENMTEIVGGPMAVTAGMVLLYDPKWVEAEDEIILATGLVHEIMHHQLRHVDRMKGVTYPKVFNMAADIFINQSLRRQTTSNGKDMWKLAPWFLTPEKYGFPEGLTSDEYYQLLLKEQEKKKKAKKKGKGGSKGEVECDDQDEDEEPAKIGSGCCGGTAGNPLSDKFEGHYDSQAGRSDVDQRNIRRQTSDSIKKAMDSPRHRGKLPAGFSELILPDEGPSPIPWNQKIGNIIRHSVGRIRSGSTDYSLRRPSKRSFLRGMLIPGLVKRDPVVVIVLDTSGSMSSGHDLPVALRESAAVLKHAGVDWAWLVQVDAAVATVQKITTQDLYEFQIVGRGGTDFRPAFAKAEELLPKPNLLIYMTDGYGPAPERPPHGIHTIWCLVPTNNAMRPAPWGDLVVVSDDVQIQQNFEE